MADFPSIPGHTIERLLGKGGMGAVYLAKQDVLDRPVALKVTLATLGELDETFAQRFVREAKTTARLKHPNIITVYEYGEHDGRCYMSMEYVPRGSLSKLLEVRRMSVDEVIDLGKGMCAGLAHAHMNGFVHRDVKPDNILLTADGLPILTDFGIVKTIHGTTNLTGTNSTVGSPAYMSPEQLMGDQRIDGRADLYSLGVVLFEMLEGRPPFADEQDYAVGMKHLMEEPPPMSPLNARFQVLISQLLQKRPEQRPGSAEQVGRELEKLRNFSGGLPPRPVRPQRSSVNPAAAPANVDWRRSRAADPGIKKAPLSRRVHFGARATMLAVAAIALLVWSLWFQDLRLAAINLELRALSGDSMEKFRVAQSLRDRGDEDRARFWWKRAMQEGYPGAAYELARSFRYQDEALAAQYLQVELNNPYVDELDRDAARLLGSLACNGRAFENCDLAIEVLADAAENFEDAGAELQLGETYRSRLRQPDYQSAMVWYLKAVDENAGDDSEQAMLQIAGLYDNGLGVDRDRKAATRWIVRAAQRPASRFTTRKEAERRCASANLRVSECSELN